MNRSSGVWFSTILILGFGGHLLWIAYEFQQWQQVLYSVPYLLAGVGLLLNKRWALNFLYFLAAWGVGGWLYGIWQTYDRGWPYPNIQRSVISLVPGLLLIAVYSGIVWIVYRHFHRSGA